MLTIRLPRSEWGKAWRAMTEVAPVRLIADDPIYEVLPAHLDALTARGFSYEVLPQRPEQSLDSLTWHIMDAMADDWESIEQIQPHVTRYHGVVDRSAVFETLRRLHRDALLRMMDENGYGIDVFPDAPETTWFSMTGAGRELWDSNGHKYRDE